MIDLSVHVSADMVQNAFANEKMVAFGHLGTHFDCMNKEFPWAFTKRNGVILDVSAQPGDDILPGEALFGEVLPDDFAIFYTGYIARVPYGSREYFKDHPQLSYACIQALLDKKVSMIGIDCAGIRRGGEHTPTDQRCADQGVFVVENLCNLEKLLAGKSSAHCAVYTFPLNFGGMSGLPARVVAEPSV